MGSIAWLENPLDRPHHAPPVILAHSVEMMRICLCFHVGPDQDNTPHSFPGIIRPPFFRKGRQMQTNDIPKENTKGEFSSSVSMVGSRAKPILRWLFGIANCQRGPSTVIGDPGILSSLFVAARSSHGERKGINDCGTQGRRRRSFGMFTIQAHCA